MEKCTLTVTITPRWWVAPYLDTLIFLNHAFGYKPDLDKVMNIVRKGLIVK